MSRYGESFRMIVKNPAVPMHDFTCNQPGLKLLQLIVGGTIECIFIPELGAAGVDLFANEDGRTMELAPNVQLLNGLLLVGPLVFMARGQDGDSVSLSDAQVLLVDNWLNTVNHAQCLL